MLLSFGVGNPHSFLDSETLDALHGYTLLQTDKNGWIELTTEGRWRLAHYSLDIKMAQPQPQHAWVQELGWIGSRLPAFWERDPHYVMVG